MDPERRRRLENLPGWSWNPLSTKWDEYLSPLKEFSDREGHCRVPKSYVTEDGYSLGEWVQTQKRNRDTIDPERKQRLEELPGWLWKVKD